jgi:uncharacterized protein
MREPPQVRLLPDGRRLYLHDGPIDLILEAFGPRDEIQTAYRAAAQRFMTVLDELCSELPRLRQRAQVGEDLPSGIVARRMVRAVAPYADRCFITPMAAVAGAVAEETLDVMTSAATLTKAYVNNGGDIAFHLSPSQQFVAGMIERPERPSLFGKVVLESSQSARGIATSGWRGRSFSLGIADAVTVLADHAAMADAAATVIANAVNLPDHPNVSRQPAWELAPDSDLGNLPVTTFVGELLPFEVDAAISTGIAAAEWLLAAGLIRAAALSLNSETRIVAPRDCESIDSCSRSLVHA